MRHYACIIGKLFGIIWKARRYLFNAKNLRADLLRMQGIISISQVMPSRLYYTQNLIFTQVSEHTLDYMHMHVKGLNDLVEQMH